MSADMFALEVTMSADTFTPKVRVSADRPWLGAQIAAEFFEQRFMLAVCGASLVLAHGFLPLGRKLVAAVEVVTRSRVQLTLRAWPQSR